MPLVVVLLIIPKAPSGDNLARTVNTAIAVLADLGS